MRFFINFQAEISFFWAFLEIKNLSSNNLFVGSIFTCEWNFYLDEAVAYGAAVLRIKQKMGWMKFFWLVNVLKETSSHCSPCWWVGCKKPFSIGVGMFCGFVGISKIKMTFWNQNSKTSLSLFIGQPQNELKFERIKEISRIQRKKIWNSRFSCQDWRIWFFFSQVRFFGFRKNSDLI